MACSAVFYAPTFQHGPEFIARGRTPGPFSLQPENLPTQKLLSQIVQHPKEFTNQRASMSDHLQCSLDELFNNAVDETERSRLTAVAR